MNTPLYNFRRSLGYSQPDIVQLTDISQSTLSKWECGQCIPDGNTLQRISRLFEIPISRLCGLQDDDFDKKFNRRRIENFLSGLDAHDRRRVISAVEQWEKNN